MKNPYQGLKLDKKPDNDNLLAWQLSMNSIIKKGLKSNVGYMCREFKLNLDEKQLHGGLYDCFKTWEIFLEFIKRTEIK